MARDTNPFDEPADAAALARYGAALVAALDETIAAWIERVIRQRWVDWTRADPPPALVEDARAAGQRARAEVVPALQELLATDVDAQRLNPLALIRRAVSHPTAVLASADVPSVPRDADAVRLFPDDVYDLSPASFAAVDPALHEPGLEWGAAKAQVILARRRAEGRS